MENVGEELDPILEPFAEADLKQAVVSASSWETALLNTPRTSGTTQITGQKLYLAVYLIVALLLKPPYPESFHQYFRLYSNDFLIAIYRFYITTKLRNPHYLPETSVKVLQLYIHWALSPS